jgi:hypothetical protein
MGLWPETIVSCPDDLFDVTGGQHCPHGGLLDPRSGIPSLHDLVLRPEGSIRCRLSPKTHGQQADRGSRELVP